MGEDSGLNAFNARLVDALQAGFPVEPAPFAALGERLGVPESLVIRRLELLRGAGVIRSIGPAFDPEEMGFTTLLVAMKVAGDRLEDVAQQVSRFRAVTQCVERDHALNVWFTIVAPSRAEADRAFEEAAGLPGVEAAHRLAPVRRFKDNPRLPPAARQDDVTPL